MARYVPLVSVQSEAVISLTALLGDALGGGIEAEASAFPDVEQAAIRAMNSRRSAYFSVYAQYLMWQDLFVSATHS